MSKATITYRFNRDNSKQTNTVSGHPEQKSQVISLLKEEYSVVEMPSSASQEHHGQDNSSEVSDAAAGFENAKPLNQFTTNFGSWRSPFDSETERLEKIIRETDEKPGARISKTEPQAEEGTDPLFADSEDPLEAYGTSELYGRNFDEPEALDRRASPFISIADVRARSHRARPGMKLIASVSGAVATGVLLGMIVLNFFPDREVKPDGSANMAANTAASDNTAPKAEGGTSGSVSEGNTAEEHADEGAAKDTAANPAEGAATDHAASMPDTYYLLQNGVFGSAEGAETAQTLLRQKGLAAAAEVSGKYYVYAGIAVKKEDAEALSKQLKDQQQTEVYIKAVNIPAADGADWTSADSSASQQFLEKSSDLIGMVSELTMLHLGESQPLPFEKTTLDAVSKEYKLWNELRSKVSGKAEASAAKMINQMSTGMKTAMDAFEAYAKKPEKTLLWDAQSAVMRVVLAEKQLLAQP